MTVVKHIIIAIILAGSTFSFIAFSERKEIPSITVCKLIGNSIKYDKQRLELHAGVVAEPHGYHLLGRECPGKSVGLVIPEYSNNDTKFTNLMRQIMAHHAKGYVVITGVFHSNRVGYQVGTFAIDDVLHVVTSEEEQ